MFIFKWKLIDVVSKYCIWAVTIFFEKGWAREIAFRGVEGWGM